MSESRSKLEVLNDFFIFFVAIIGLIVFWLSSMPTTGFTISTNGMLLFVLVIVLLLFRHFSKIQIPGLLTLTKKIEEVRDEAKELRLSLTQVLAKAQSSSSSVVNFGLGHYVKDNASDAQEIIPEIPQAQLSERTSSESERILKYISQKDYAAAFFTVRNKIENQLARLVEIQTGEKPKYRSSIELLRQLRNSSMLDPPMLDAINFIRANSNAFIHMSSEQSKVSAEELDKIVDLAIRVISKLDAQIDYVSKNKEYFIR
jgi:hypothetical protein